MSPTEFDSKKRLDVVQWKPCACFDVANYTPGTCVIVSYKLSLRQLKE